MTYELAKELAEAGFRSGGGEYRYRRDIKSGTPYRVHRYSQYTSSAGEVLCAAPTLADLIEACGETLAELRQNPETGEWGATNTSDWWTQSRHTAVGSSPEEAVARLWLALNNP
jgi:hypothetical protein